MLDTDIRARIFALVCSGLLWFALVCSGLLGFGDFAPDMAKLDMEHWLEGESAQLGFDSAPSALQSSAA